MPFYHCFGMVMGNLGAVTHGACIVIPAPGVRPGRDARAVAAERCTSLYGVPTMFIAELGHEDFATFDLTSLRTGIMAGSPCPVEVMKRVAARHAHDRGRHLLRHDGDLAGVDADARRTTRSSGASPRSGAPGPHVEVKVVDPDTGLVVPRGETGELCTRGYSVMLGYWDEPEKTAEAIDAARWMHTGDLATMDDDGYCNIVGRIKDMVIRGGENVYPREIEEFLYTHEDVADVSGRRRAGRALRRGAVRVGHRARAARARRGRGARVLPRRGSRTTRSRATWCSSTSSR